MNIPPTTLDDLTWGWGDAYLFSYARDRWIALRRDTRYFLTAETLAGLEQAIMADYRDNPVSRDYDPAQSGGEPDDGDARDDKDGEVFADADTPDVLTLLRQTFPQWAISFSRSAHVWTAQTDRQTIAENSPVLLCVALVLIERRQRQASHGPRQDGPPVGRWPSVLTAWKGDSLGS